MSTLNLDEKPAVSWFEQSIAATDLRLTPARTKVIRVMEKHLDRLSPEEIAIECRAGRATIYRLFRVLVDKGILCRVNREDGSAYYHAAHVRHEDHLICRRCGRMMELDLTPLRAAFQAEARKLGYFLVTSKIEASGVCRRCYVQRNAATA